MRKSLHIALLLLVAVVSCRGPRVIPRDTLTDIYYDMFLADQQIREEPRLRSQADTMLVYEAVFNRYGYTTDDYLYSLRSYLKDPERFARVLEEVVKRFQEESDALNREIERLDWMARFLQMRKPPVDSILSVFCRDSVYLGLPRVVRDSSRYGALYRLAAWQADTLMRPLDSLSVVRDSLAEEESVPAPADEPQPEDTVEPLSPERVSARPRIRDRYLPREAVLEEEVQEEVVETAEKP